MNSNHLIYLSELRIVISHLRIIDIESVSLPSDTQPGHFVDATRIKYDMAEKNPGCFYIKIDLMRFITKYLPHIGAPPIRDIPDELEKVRKSNPTLQEFLSSQPPQGDYYPRTMNPTYPVRLELTAAEENDVNRWYRYRIPPLKIDQKEAVDYIRKDLVK